MKTYLCNKSRHNLLHHARHDGSQHKDRKDDVLNPLLRRIGVKEGEGDEEGGDDAKNELGIDVLWHSPVLGEDTLGDAKVMLV